MTSLSTPTVEDLQAHGTNVGPGERYWWFNNQLWVVEALPSDSGAEHLTETFDVVPGERTLHQRRLLTVRKNTTPRRTCADCSTEIGYLHYYAASSNGDGVCLKCLKGVKV